MIRRRLACVLAVLVLTGTTLGCGGGDLSLCDGCTTPTPTPTATATGTSTPTPGPTATP